MSENDIFFGFFLSMFIFIMIIALAVSILTIVGMWKVFEKAGKPGWAAIVPIYNYIVLLEIAELPTWYIALYFIPFANIYAQVVTYIEIVKRFNESTGFVVGLLLLPYVFWPILGSKKYKYTKSNSKFCPSCGTKLEGNANFCSKCGYKFN